MTISNKEIEPRVELRAVKYAAFASHETACFEATVVVDGKPFCRVANEGHGGEDFFEPLARGGRADLEGGMLAVAQRVNEHAQTRYAEAHEALESWEDYEAAYASGDYFRTGIRTSAEILSWLVGRALDRYLVERDVTRMLKTQLLALHADGKVYGWRLKDKRPGAWAQHERAIRDHAAKGGNAITAVLNALPFPEAVDMYQRATQ